MTATPSETETVADRPYAPAVASLAVTTRSLCRLAPFVSHPPGIDRMADIRTSGGD